METLPVPLRSMLRTARVKHLPRGQILQYEGDPVVEVFVLKKGVVKIYDIDEQGNEKILHLIKPYTVFPYAFLSGDDSVTRWFYSALTACDVYVLDPAALRQSMQEDRMLTITMLEDFSRDVHELLTRLSSLGKTNAQDKIIAALRFLAARHSKPLPGQWQHIVFPVSHQLLADMVGITRESTAGVMKSLQDQGVIRNPRLSRLEIQAQKLN